MAKEKKIITKENWVSNFNLIGEAKVSDYTFKIDEKSTKSAWVYNSMNLGVDCGEKHGTVYAEMMGGYGENQSNGIYAHGKKEDGADDFSTQIIIDWDDRFNEDILDEIGDMCFITVGLETTDKGKTFYKKFLSQYDAINYIKEHLRDGMVVNVRGNLKYSTYNDVTQVRKNITSIVLSKVDDKSKYSARFTQSVLLDKYSASLKNNDKNKGVIYIDAKVLDYIKEYNGIEVKGQYPFSKQFEFAMDFSDETKCKKIMEKLFKVKKDITQINFEGELIEGGATVMPTLDDIPQDIKDLIELGIYTEEQALARCATNGNREQRMVLKSPVIRNTEDGDKVTSFVQRYEEKYTEEDLILDYLYENDLNNDVVENENVEISDTDDVDDWLSKL